MNKMYQRYEYEDRRIRIELEKDWEQAKYRGKS